jgi:hypothetical protein
MHDWTGTIALATQALFAVMTIDQLRRNIFPALDQLRARALVTDVWSPLAIVLPMLFFLSRTVEGSVAGSAWVGVAGPIACAVVGLGSALIVNRCCFLSLNLLSVAIWTGAGLVLLLLGAAHHLTLWMGQCAFALAAVLLWINTPDDADASTQLSVLQLRAGLGLALAVFAALCQGAASLFVPDHSISISGGIMLAGGAMTAAAAARFAGPEAAIRISGWSATYGVLLGLGVLSLLRLIPAVYLAAAEEIILPVRRVAHGFGAYWIEATMAIAFAGSAGVLMRLPGAIKRVVGLGLIIAAAVLTAWRLSQI